MHLRGSSRLVGQGDALKALVHSNKKARLAPRFAKLHCGD
jgi:hypothetical protein